MDDNVDSNRVSRRAFLRRAGCAAGMLAAAPLLGALGSAAPAHATSHPQQADPIRVGVLLPQSRRYPDLGPSFLAGMQAGLSQPGGRAVALLTRDYGLSPARALEQTQELIERDRVDLVVSTVGSGSAAALEPLLQAREVPLIVSGVGANVARHTGASGYIFRNSLGYWRSTWAMGDWAARNLGATAFSAMSFYESGYDAYYTFELGFEGAGGHVAQARVTHRPGDAPGHLAALMDDIRRARPDLVFAAYSGADAADFLRAYAAAGLARRIPLVGAGFLADERLLAAEVGAAAAGVRTVLPWSAQLATAENRAFAQAMRATASRASDPFAVLGYDTAQMIARAAPAAGAADGRGERLRQALASAAFAGPRGPVALDLATLEVSSPLYLREVRHSGGRWRNQVIADLGAATMPGHQLQALLAATKTGWQHAYLCA